MAPGSFCCYRAELASLPAVLGLGIFPLMRSCRIHYSPPGEPHTDLLHPAVAQGYARLESGPGFHDPHSPAVPLHLRVVWHSCPVRGQGPRMSTVFCTPWVSMRGVHKTPSNPLLDELVYQGSLASSCISSHISRPPSTPLAAPPAAHLPWPLSSSLGLLGPWPHLCFLHRYRGRRRRCCVPVGAWF